MLVLVSVGSEEASVESGETHRWARRGQQSRAFAVGGKGLLTRAKVRTCWVAGPGLCSVVAFGWSGTVSEPQLGSSPACTAGAFEGPESLSSPRIESPRPRLLHKLVQREIAHAADIWSSTLGHGVVNDCPAIVGTVPETAMAVHRGFEHRALLTALFGFPALPIPVFD
jgi:hypothetical protein